MRQLVLARVQVERGLNLRPQEGDPVQPLMEDRQEQAELQPRGSALVPFFGSPGVGVVPVVFPVFGVGLGERAVQNRRMPQQEVQDCADAASGAFLVEGVEQVVSGADQVVRVGVVGAVVGGWVFGLFGGAGVTGLNLYSLLVAVVGAVLVLVVYHAIRRAA